MNSRYIMSVDIGSSQIKALAATCEPDGQLTIRGYGMMPTAGFHKGRIEDVQALAAAIRQAVDCVQLSSDMTVNHIYLGLGGMGLATVAATGSIAVSQPTGITADDIDKVYQAAILATVSDADEVLHILPHVFYVDQKPQRQVPIGQPATHLKTAVQLVTVPKAELSALRAALQIQGLQVQGTAANHVILSQAALSVGDGMNVLLLDIGAGTTDIAICQEGEWLHFASLPLGAAYITSDLQQGLGVSQTHAEEIKRYYAKLDTGLRGKNIMLDCNDYGTTDKQFPYDFLYDIIESRIDEIVFLVYDYCKSYFGQVPPAKVLLTGGGAAMPQISDSIVKQMGLPVEVILPESVALEYQHPANMAGYAALQHAQRHLPRQEVEDRPLAVSGFLYKIKQLFS